MSELVSVTGVPPAGAADASVTVHVAESPLPPAIVAGLQLTAFRVCPYTFDVISVVPIAIPATNLKCSIARLSLTEPPPPPGARWEPRWAQCKPLARAIEALNCPPFPVMTR
jgi:hypothetical protein